MRALKKRIVSIELLRILSMLMVVMLHYLSKGGFLQPLTEEFIGNHYIAWLLEAFCIVAVNVYMLISGYFLVEVSFKLSRLAELICQVLFYSILIPAVLVLTGVLPMGELGVYRLAQYVLPIHMEQYWFATAYVGMYLFSPLLAAAAKQMEKRQLQLVIILLLLYWSVPKSVIPVQLTLDLQGYDVVWFMCVFLVAAYIRLYGLPLLDSSQKAALCYFLFVGLIFGQTMLLRGVYLKTGSLAGFIQNAYHYNHIWNLCAAVSLFCAFIRWDINSEGRFAKLVCKVAPYTFGVYLLHEHVEIRWLWPSWFGCDASENPALLFFRALTAVTVVFIAGILTDMLRGRIFALIKKLEECLWKKEKSEKKG